MLSNKVDNKVHKCYSKLNNTSVATFCSECGAYISRDANQPAYLRSAYYKVAEPYRLNPCLTLAQLKQKQHASRHYKPNASFVKYRAELLGFLVYLVGKMGYSEKTHHMAIGVLDTFLCQVDVHSSDLKFVCFVALHVAAKMEEKFVKIPDVAAIQRLFDNKYNAEQICDFEMAVCKANSFSLDLKTPFVFVEYFLTKGAINESEIRVSSVSEKNAQVEAFENAVMHFLRLSTKHYDFNGYAPITVAAAAILCARKSLGFENCWSFDLELLTTVRLIDLLGCSKALYKIHKVEAGIPSKKNKNCLGIYKSSIGSKSGCSIQTVDSETNGMTPCGSKTNFEDCAMVMDADEQTTTKNATVYNIERKC